MSWPKDADGNSLRDIHIESRLDAVDVHMQVGAKYRPRYSYSGPASTDSPTVTTGVAADAAFNKYYAISGGALPAVWPVDAWGKLSVLNNTWLAFISDNTLGSVTTYRMMSDGSEIMIFGGATNWLMDLFIDGYPYASNPITLSATAGFGTYGLTKLVFADARPRLLEWRTFGGVTTVYTKNPYHLWKPAPDTNPKIAVVGDSWVYPSTLSDTIAANASPDPFLRGAYQRMAPHLGLTSLTTDGIGATGYIADAVGAQQPFGGAQRLAWLQAVNPDVIIVHDGGVNDRYYGNSVNSIITAAVAYFTTLRANHPNARLVFVEGFIPPGFAAFAADAIAIRQGVQAALNAAGIKVYYLDVATTQPPIYGTGRVTATNGTGNSDIYIGSDSYHPSASGHAFIRRFLSNKIARVLADNGSLAGELI